MNKHTQAIYNDLDQLGDDARALLSATSDVAGEQIAAARKRLNSTLERGLQSFNRLEDQTLSRARTSITCAMNHPYRSVAILAGVGALIGVWVAFGIHRCGDRHQH